MIRLLGESCFFCYPKIVRIVRLVENQLFFCVLFLAKHKKMQTYSVAYEIRKRMISCTSLQL